MNKHSPSKTAQLPRILLVEDDLDVRDCLELILQAHGYQVQTASGIEDVMALMPCCCDLLISDIMLPCLKGHDLARNLTHSLGNPLCLYISGHDPSYLAKHNIDIDGSPFLTKPFSKKEFLDAVETLLSGWSDPATRSISWRH